MLGRLQDLAQVSLVSYRILTKRTLAGRKLPSVGEPLLTASQFYHCTNLA